MATFSSVEDLRNAVGSELGPIDWIDITQHDISVFATLTHDEQWIHVDAARAAKSPFGATVAHGYFVLALVAPAVMGLMTINGATVFLNYGLNKVRFPAPVRTGSRIRARLRLLSVDDHGEGTLFVSKATVEVEGQAKPACVAEVVTYVETDS